MARRASNHVILLALGGVIAVGGVLLIFSAAFDGRIRSLDKGVLEIINGDGDYWFEIQGTGVASTMAQNLNIMVCQLSGRPLPDEEDKFGRHTGRRTKCSLKQSMMTN